MFVQYDQNSELVPLFYSCFTLILVLVSSHKTHHHQRRRCDISYFLYPALQYVACCTYDYTSEYLDWNGWDPFCVDYIAGAGCQTYCFSFPLFSHYPFLPLQLTVFFSNEECSPTKFLLLKHYNRL